MLRTPLRATLALATVLALPIGLAACGDDSSAPGEISSDDVAVVGDAVVSRADFDRRLKLIAATMSGGGVVVIPDPPGYEKCIAALRELTARSMRQLPKGAQKPPAPATAQLKQQCEQRGIQLRQQTMSALIQPLLVAAQAKDLGIEVTDAQIEKLSRQQFPRQRDFAQMLTRTGMTRAEFMRRLRDQALQTAIAEKLRERATTKVGDDQVADYYTKNKRQFAMPERRSVELLRTKTKGEAEDAKATIGAGTSWANAIKEFSADPYLVATKGLIPNLVKGQFDPEVSRVVFRARRGVLVGPIKTPRGWYVARVQRVFPADQRTLAESRDQIRQQLSQQDVQKAYAAFQDKWKKTVACRDGYVVPACGNAPAPRQPTTPAVR